MPGILPSLRQPHWTFTKTFFSSADVTGKFLLFIMVLKQTSRATAAGLQCPKEFILA
jgi:hypothetical protein